MKTVIGLFFLMSITSAFAQSSEMDKEYKAIQKVVKQAQTVAAKNLACNKTSQCKVKEFGSLACGGAQGAIVYSAKNPQAKTVVSLAKKSVTMEETFNARWGIFSICTVAVIPVPTCVNQVCVAR